MKVKKISAANVEACSLPRLFDEEKIEVDLSKEKKLQSVTLDIKKKYGKNALLKGTDLQEGATTRERNKMIGGHNA